MISPLLTVLLAANIAGWRTDGTGRHLHANPPTAWSTNQNIVWSTKLTHWSNASPVLSGDRFFICAEPATLVCASATDGKILWERPHTYTDAFPAEAAKINEMQRQAELLTTELRDAEKQLRDLKKKREKSPDDQGLNQQEAAAAAAKCDNLKKRLAPLNEWRMPATHAANGYSSCTPVTDGQHVFALFGNGVAACYSVDGTRRWIKLIERPTSSWGQSSSPALVEGKLILLINALYALDARTGDQLWRVNSKQRCGSPVSARVGNTNVIVTPGGDIVRAGDGKVLVTGLTALEFNVPLVQDGVAYFIQHGGTAVKLIPESDGVRTETLWTTQPKKERYYSSPLLHDGLIYAINQKSILSVIDAMTGAVVHERDLALKGTVYPSIALAGRYLFVSSDNGITVVLEPGRETKEIARNTFSPFRSSPVFRGDRLFIRAFDALYCIGK
jgi:outer membrane protein assembly factor BamB